MMTLREKIEALLKPAIDVCAPYAVILVDTLIKLAEAEGAQARKIEGLALAQVKETTAVLDLVSLERNELRAELAKLNARLNDLHDVPPEHESEPLAFHLGWELAVRAVSA